MVLCLEGSCLECKDGKGGNYGCCNPPPPCKLNENDEGEFQCAKPGTTRFEACDYEFCGGIAGIQCPSGFTCEDDPRDTCDPKTGGADCGGICVESPGINNYIHYC